MCGPSIFTVRLEIDTRNSPESHRPDNFQYTKLWDNKEFLYRVSGGLISSLHMHAVVCIHGPTLTCTDPYTYAHHTREHMQKNS